MLFPLKDENPTKKFSYITLVIIIVNCLVFFVHLVGGRYYRSLMATKFGVIPYEIMQGVDLSPDAPLHQILGHYGIYLTLITSQFLHGSFWHILGNMWFLWIFGNNVEDIVGHGKFLFFYLLGGIAAALLQVVLTADSTVPMIGASGAVSAVLGAYILKFPRARVRSLVFIFIFITVINVPAVAFIGIWFFLQVLSSLSGPMAGVAWFAHIGGFVFGLLFIKVFEKRQNRPRYRIY
jgi:membrane associated rhomboid family serine protease